MITKHKTNSFSELMQKFSTEQEARLFFEKHRFHHGRWCPYCKSKRKISDRKGRIGVFHCNDCHKEFTIRTGTVMENTHVPYRKWLLAMYLVLTSRKSISSTLLAKKIEVTQKTAWLLLQKIKDGCLHPRKQLYGTVEIYETYINNGELSENSPSNKLQWKWIANKCYAIGKTTEYRSPFL